MKDIKKTANKKFNFHPKPHLIPSIHHLLKVALSEKLKQLDKDVAYPLKALYCDGFWDRLDRHEYASFSFEFKNNCQKFGFEFVGKKGTSSCYKILD